MTTRRVPGAGTRVAPAYALGTSGRTRRVLSPLLLRATAPLARSTLRLDLHPGDFEHIGHVRAVEHVLAQAAGRRPVTYDELAFA